MTLKNYPQNAEGTTPLLVMTLVFMWTMALKERGPSVEINGRGLRETQDGGYGKHDCGAMKVSGVHAESLPLGIFGIADMRNKAVCRYLARMPFVLLPFCLWRFESMECPCPEPPAEPSPPIAREYLMPEARPRNVKAGAAARRAWP